MDVWVLGKEDDEQSRGAPWMAFLVGSIFSRAGMQKAAVLPVPFLARARMSRPVSAMGMLSSWMGDGRSNPRS